MAASSSLRKSRSVSYMGGRRTHDEGSGYDHTSEEPLSHEQSSHILVKQTELDNILDRHDNLVCCIFFHVLCPS